MRVLVTGAGGFLGRRVTDALLAKGLVVRAMIRPGADLSQLTWGDRVEIVEADLRTDHDLGRALSGIDVVVHLAARVSGSDDERFASTVVGTERLLSALPEHAVGRFVLVSSYSVYDWHAASGRLTEDSRVAVRPYDRDGYAVAKVWQERITREAADELGFELVVLRPGFIWGDESLEVAGLGVRLARCLLVIGPRARPPMTHVENCANLVVLAVLRGEAAGRTFNVVDTPMHSNWHWARLLAPQGRAPTRIPVPYGFAMSLVRSVALASRVLFPAGGRLPSIFVPVRFEARFKPLAHTAESAVATLGWAPEERARPLRRSSRRPPIPWRRSGNP